MKNYFEFFELDESFEIDLKELRMRYISNSKKYHPDYHTLSNTAHQENILELSTLNNEAWKTLSNRQKRIAHLLKIHNAMPEEGKATVPQEFLMEMMDINEDLMELEFDADENKKIEVLKKLDDINNNIEKAGLSAMKKWDQHRDDKDLELVRDFYLKQKYILRIKERLG